MQLVPFLMPAETQVLVLLSASAERLGVSSMRAVVFCIFCSISSSATRPLQVWAAGARGAQKQVPGTTRGGRGGEQLPAI